MAIYRLETKIIGRQARNRAKQIVPNREISVIAKAAYRAGQKLKGERAEQIFNYASRRNEVAHAEIMLPEKAPDWMRPEGGKTRDQRERLWNAVEAKEARKDSQLAREFILSLPVELNKEQRIELVRGWCREEFVGKGFVVDFSLHKSKNEKNPHAHVLCVTRPVEGDGFGKKPDTAGKFNGRGAAGVGAKDDLGRWRESWEKHENAALEQAGRQERVSSKSLKDQGVDKVPQPKIGVDAVAMKKKGKIYDPEAMKRVREVKMLNEILPYLRDFQRGDHVRRLGQVTEWWQRTRGRVRQLAERVGEKLRPAKSWRDVVSHHAKPAQSQPQKARGRSRE